uniref:hypothetical protein n=1 Tax=Pseudomonas sp. KCJK9044 TaxID=3344562 RepID=UPI003905BE67
MSGPITPTVIPDVMIHPIIRPLPHAVGPTHIMVGFVIRFVIGLVVGLMAGTIIRPVATALTTARAGI